MNNTNDQVRMQHMLDAAVEVQQFITGESRASLDTDLKLLRAICMSVGIIGEAASRVSNETRANYPEIPWTAIIGMRNFIFHAYFQVDNDILWETAVKAVPDLAAQLEKLLSEKDTRQ